MRYHFGLVGRERAPSTKLRGRDVNHLKIRKNGQIALSQHPLHAIRSDALSRGLQNRGIGCQRPSIELCLLDRPHNSMSMVEAEASLSFAFRRIFFAEASIRGRNRGALLQDVDIGGVGGSEVVVIQAILEL